MKKKHMKLKTNTNTLRKKYIIKKNRDDIQKNKQTNKHLNQHQNNTINTPSHPPAAARPCKEPGSSAHPPGA